jgi:hypothetical protein
MDVAPGAPKEASLKETFEKKVEEVALPASLVQEDAIEPPFVLSQAFNPRCVEVATGRHRKRKKEKCARTRASRSVAGGCSQWGSFP